jgi:hypothetical protein
MSLMEIRAAELTADHLAEQRAQALPAWAVVGQV